MSRYSMMINWSDEDQVYVVCLPEFGLGAKTHGVTYGEAARMGEELIASLVEWHSQEGKPLPQPLAFDPVANFAPDPFTAEALAAELSGRGRMKAVMT